MTRKQLGKLIGGPLLIAAVASVFLVKWRPEIEQPPPPIRPLKTLVVGTPYSGMLWQYPGRVRAAEQAEMAFEVAGTVKDLLVVQGDDVEEGQVLARLDDRDYKNAFLAAEAELRRAQAQLDRVREARAANAVSAQEESDAQASYDKAEARYNIQKKAHEDTELKARFDGVIARTYIQTYENVQAKQPILNLQKIDTVEIEASIPEARIAQLMPHQRARVQDIANTRFTATFDYFPEKTFKLSIKEFSTESDPVTQTYSAVFTMEVSTNFMILPGMTTMVTEENLTTQIAETDAGLLVPLDLVPVDGLGQYFVWVVGDDDGEIFSVTRREVEVDEASRTNQIVVTAGLAPGDRIAAAGVHVLQEGQKVRLLHADD